MEKIENVLFKPNFLLDLMDNLFSFTNCYNYCYPILDNLSLKSAPLYNHIAYVIDQVEKGSFVDIYSNILLKILLPKRKHTNELTVKKWQCNIFYLFLIVPIMSLLFFFTFPYCHKAFNFFNVKLVFFQLFHKDVVWLLLIQGYKQ